MIDPTLASLLEALRQTGMRWQELARYLPPEQSTILAHAAMELGHVTQPYQPTHSRATSPLPRH